MSWLNIENSLSLNLHTKNWLQLQQLACHGNWVFGKDKNVPARKGQKIHIHTYRNNLLKFVTLTSVLYFNVCFTP